MSRREDVHTSTESDAGWHAYHLGRDEDLSSPPFPGEYREDDD